MIQKVIGLVLWLFLIGLANANLMEDIKSGDVLVSLGNDIEMSFVLPEEIESYDIETANMSNDIFKFNRYDIYINKAGSNDSILTLMFSVYQEPQNFPIFEEKLENDLEEYGKSITMPVEIDGNIGHAVYNYPEGNPAIDPLKASGAAFMYYPSASPKEEDLEGIYEVHGDTMGAAHEGSEVMQVFQNVMETIHITGL